MQETLLTKSAQIFKSINIFINKNNKFDYTAVDASGNNPRVIKKKFINKNMMILLLNYQRVQETSTPR